MLTPPTAAWLVPRRAEKRSAGDHVSRAGLRQHAPKLNQATALAEDFTGPIHNHAPDRLDPWLQRAGNSTVRQLRGFAKRLRAGYNAVRAGVALAWSNGQTEGQGNRLRTLRRQRYGRASLDLLGQRFLLAS